MDNLIKLVNMYLVRLFTNSTGGHALNDGLDWTRLEIVGQEKDFLE